MTWDNSAITITTLLPIVGAVVIVCMPKEKDRLVRGLGIVFTAVALVLAIAIAVGFDYGRGEFAVRPERPVDRGDRRPLPRGDRRHLDAARTS